MVAIISDTHGLLRPEAIAALQGVDLIIHAGDIGRSEILESLKALAPVRAVRGNVDKDTWAQQLPETEVFEIEDFVFYVLHDLQTLDLDPVAAGFSVAISGHTHRPGIEEREGILFINPGSAGPRRFDSMSKGFKPPPLRRVAFS